MLGGNALALLILTFIWCAFFAAFRDLRREQMISSLFASAIFPVVFAYATQTVPTTLLLERIAFLFLVGGLSSVIFHIAFGQYYLKTPRHLVSKRKHAQTWIWNMLAILFGAAWTMVIFSLLWPSLSAGWIMLLTGGVFALYYAIYRHDLLFDALMSAFLMVALFAMVDLVMSSAALPLLTKDVYLQAAGLGLFFGPLYEFARNIRLRHVAF